MAHDPGPPYEWDHQKNFGNLRIRGFSFDLIHQFDWSTALNQRDHRQTAEERWISLGLIDHRLYVAVWTPRDSSTRIISLRKANDREAARYAQAKR